MIEIYNSNQKLVRTLINKNQSAGSNTALWDGKDNYGMLVTDGTYTYRITATNSVNGGTAQAEGTITTDKTKPTVTGVKANPSEFSPEGIISYTTYEDLKITAKILKGTGNVVRVLESNVSKTDGYYSVEWDGRDSNGNIVANGKYTYKITFTDAAGLTTEAVGTITVNVVQLTITEYSHTPNPYNPIGANGGINPGTIVFTLSEDAAITAAVYDSNGNLVKTLATDKNYTAGENYLTWYGSNNSGDIVDQGTYTYRISGVTSDGRKCEVSGTITVKY